MVMGRPKKPDAERMEKPLRIRLTAEQRKALDRAAKNAGQETSTWAREQLLKIAGRPKKDGKKTIFGTME